MALKARIGKFHILAIICIVVRISSLRRRILQSYRERFAVLPGRPHSRVPKCLSRDDKGKSAYTIVCVYFLPKEQFRTESLHMVYKRGIMFAKMTAMLILGRRRNDSSTKHGFYV